jgi:DNA-binding transcriptional MerR regulator
MGRTFNQDGTCRVKIIDLMRELDLEIDDLRWYLSAQQTERLLQYRSRPAELARLIWSGALEQELYNMEERLVEQLQQDLDQGLRDEVGVREILAKAGAARAGRYAPEP